MLLTFENVSLSYPPHHRVLDKVDFSLEDNGFYFLTGASGAGKSSLLRLIYQAEKATSGRIFLFGELLDGQNRTKQAEMRRKIGVIFQDFRLIPHLTALENAALPLRLTDASEDYIHRHSRELLDWVGIGDRMNAYPHELSGGEQQRVAIARAVVARPRLLLADEPTGNVDDDTALKLFHLFDELNKIGTAVILATHQHYLVDRFRKPALRLLDGRLISAPPSKAA
ncbi:MAG: ATP-binding cassette domain-containing protein [Alphaproteobacteria bacterium]|nr:ATP-binding cassette domain-containing protein [Alphaproteobacteria bacterium]